MVRRTAPLGEVGLPAHRRVAQLVSRHRGRYVRHTTAWRQTGAPSRPLCRIAALSSWPGPKSPGESRIFVDGEPYTWRDGEDLLFDETFVHCAENTTSDTHIILFCDVERPLRSLVMTAVNRWVCHHVVRQIKTQNVDGEPAGAFNEMFAYIYQVRLVGKRMKAWNNRVYYAVKFSILGLALAAVVYSVFA
jgi:hypothetical protein